MNIVTLSKNFYNCHTNDKEILKKESRPYTVIIVEVEGSTFAIPFRSHISHKYAYWTDKDNQCGLDFTKSVVIVPSRDIDKTGVQIRQNEYNAIKGQEYEITKKFKSFLNTYRKAYKRQDIKRNRQLIENSALQYFIALII